MDLVTYKNQEFKPQKHGFLDKLSNAFIKHKRINANLHSMCEKDDIIESLKDAKSEWINANLNFEYAYDSEMIDYYTYKIKACQVRYEYYLKKAKKTGIKVDALDTANTGISCISIKAE